MSNVAYADFGAVKAPVERKVAELEDGYAKLSNMLLEAYAGADLTKRQFKVLLAILRKTYGWNKPMDRISDSQINHIKSTSYGRKAFLASVVVLNACCDKDAGPLTGVFHPSKGNGRTFKIRKGALPESDMLLIAQSLMTHGVIGKAKVRRLQRHESGETSAEFRAVDYIVAAQAHFGMTEQEAGNLTMTKFQMLLATKYPEQKGFTREEYDQVADDYLARKAKRLANAA